MIDALVKVAVLVLAIMVVNTRSMVEGRGRGP